MSGDSRRFPDLRVSASAIGLMERCPRAWAYRYMFGLPAEHVSSSQILGIGVHRALAAFYLALRDGRTEPTVIQMLDLVVSAIDEAEIGEAPILFTDDENREALITDARQLLTAFLARPYRPAQVVAVEEPFTFALTDPDGEQEFEEMIVGVMDLVSEDGPGLVRVTDHKVWRRRSNEGVDTQFALYAMAAASMFPDAVEIRLQRQVLLRQKTVAVESQSLPYTAGDLQEGIDAALSAVTMAHAAIGHANPLRLLGRRRSWACKTCEFIKTCAAPDRRTCIPPRCPP